MTDPRPGVSSVSVIIPARDAADAIGHLVRTVRAQRRPGLGFEVIIVDDGSRDGTGEAAEREGARVVRRPRRPEGGNPAAARNRGARDAEGDLLVFLDADCVPTPGWLRSLLEAHERGETVVGGSLELPPGLVLSARCDYYCGWYNAHARRPAGPVPNHPPGNLSVRRELFLSTCMFEERQPIAFAHEELGWQAEIRRRGHVLWFEPRAVVWHYNRPGLGNLLRRNYRWAYSSLESKHVTRSARFEMLYRFPRLVLLSAPILAVLQAAYILVQWGRARRLEPWLLAPMILAARTAYAAGLVAGGIRWLRGIDGTRAEYWPRWE